jgi:uncharacterized protein YbjT (DUF2867 family)
MRVILITGATGAVGSAAVRSLARKPGVHVRAAVHARPGEVQAANIEAVPVDFGRPETLRAAAEGVDAALMITPPAPNQAVLASQLLEALKTAGIPRLVRLSVMGADGSISGAFFREHAETERQIRESGIPCTFLRASGFMSNFITFFRPDRQGNLRLPSGEGAVSFIDPRDIGEVAARVLTTGGHDGAAYTLTGPEAITLQEVAAAISSATGNPCRYLDIPEDAMRQEMLAMGVPPPMVEGILETFSVQREGKMSLVTPAVQDLTGHPARSIHDFARDHAAAWKTADAAA